MLSITSRLRNYSLTLAAGLVTAAGTAQADFVIADDLIVDGSACIGFDCVNGESFGFDTIRLKENNLRIKFDDTSVAASFPRNDWQLTANDSANGGASKFSIDDISGGRTPFTVTAGAPSHSIFVSSGGLVGFGTSVPSVDLHVKDGDTPTLRLEQDTSSGFAAQTWDVAGNETNFFVRDVTGGSTLPLRLRPGAPSNAIFVDTDGDVGMGTSSVDSALHIQRNTGASAELLKLENNGGSFITLSNTAAGVDWFFTHENAAAGRFIITNSALPGEGLFYEQDGDMTIGGVLTENSDKNAKMAIEPVDTAEILAKVTALPVSAWTYKDDAEAARHVGPMAQDFYALFGLGATETGISTLDTSGVALAAIQALAERADASAAHATDLAVQVAAQQALIEQLVAGVEALRGVE